MTPSEIDITKLKLVYTAEIPVRWRDLDDLGHVNNSVYFTYFEQARVEWWHSLDEALEADKQGPVIVTANCNFLKPLFYPAMLQVKVHAGLPGNSSYIIYYEIFSKNELIAQGSTKIVWVDYAKGKALPLPEKIREMIG